MATAAKLFATRPFHKVKLDDVAAAAGVGKGTLYVYFPSKEDLYFSLIYDGFAEVVAQLESQVGHDELPPRETLSRLILGLVEFGFDNPHYFELIRTAGVSDRGPKFAALRKKFSDLIEHTIRRGVKLRVFDDPHPELTALCVPGYVRFVILFGPRGIDRKVVADHLVRLIERGILAPASMSSPGRANGKSIARPAKHLPPARARLAVAGINGRTTR